MLLNDNRALLHQRRTQIINFCSVVPVKASELFVQLPMESSKSCRALLEDENTSRLIVKMKENFDRRVAIAKFAGLFRTIESSCPKRGSLEGLSKGWHRWRQTISHIVYPRSVEASPRMPQPFPDRMESM